MEPPLITPIKEMYNGKSEKGFVKLKLRRDPMSSTQNLYEFKRSLFDHGGPEEFLLFVRNFNMTLEATGTLEMDASIHYHRMVVRGEALHQFDLFSAEMENTETLNIKGLALYPPPCKFAFKTKACDLPWNKKHTQSKIKTICGALD